MRAFVLLQPSISGLFCVEQQSCCGHSFGWVAALQGCEYGYLSFVEGLLEAFVGSGLPHIGELRDGCQRVAAWLQALSALRCELPLVCWLASWFSLSAIIRLRMRSSLRWLDWIMLALPCQDGGAGLSLIGVVVSSLATS